MDSKKIVINEGRVASLADNTTKKYRLLSDYQCSLLLSLCEYLHWEKRYENLTKDMVAMQKIASDIETEWMSAYTMTLDCGDVLDCFGPDKTDIYQQIKNLDQATVAQVAGKRVQLYDGTPQSINKNAPSFASDNTQDGINELCHAARILVAEYRQAKLAQINFALIGTYLVAAVGVAETLTGIGALFGAATTGIGLILGETLEGAKTVLEDDTAAEEVACCIAEYLNDRRISQSNYDAALANDCHINGSNADIFRQLLAMDRATLEGYLYFIDALGVSQAITTLEDCECIEPTNCTAGTIQYWPDATGITLEDARVTFSSGVTFSTTNTAPYVSATMGLGHWLEIEADSPLCIRYFQYSIRASAGGSGTPTGKISVNGIVTNTTTPLYSVAGATETNKSAPVTSDGNTLKRGSVLRLEIQNTTTRTVQIWLPRLRHGG